MIGNQYACKDPCTHTISIIDIWEFAVSIWVAHAPFAGANVHWHPRSANSGNDAVELRVRSLQHKPNADPQKR